MSNFKSNVTSDAFWVRTLYLVGFFLVYGVLDLLVLLLTVAQWLFVLLTGKPNEALAGFGGSLGIFMKQIIQYLTGSTAEKPFPFQDWPTRGPEDHIE